MERRTSGRRGRAKTLLSNSETNKMRQEVAMADTVTLQEVEAIAAKLTPADRRLLAEKLLQDDQSTKAPRRHWSEIRGTASYPLCGEDAQAWVSRTRREDDNCREKQRRPS